jgi:hypothetical protein
MRNSVYPRHGDFGDAEVHARAMATHGPVSADDIDLFVGLPGPFGAVMTAAWGTAAQRAAEVDAEVRAEARARWSLFIDKAHSRTRSAVTGDGHCATGLDAVERGGGRGNLRGERICAGEGGYARLVGDFVSEAIGCNERG